MFDLEKSDRNERGATMVEVAMTIGLFFLLIVGALDFTRLYFTSHTLSHVLAEASRNTVILTATVQNENTVKAELRADIMVLANRFGVELDDTDIVICLFNDTSTFCSSKDLPNNYFSVFASKEIDIIGSGFPFYAKAQTMARFQSNIIESI